jgi:hypothetical protein
VSARGREIDGPGHHRQHAKIDLHWIERKHLCRRDAERDIRSDRQFGGPGDREQIQQRTDRQRQREGIDVVADDERLNDLDAEAVQRCRRQDQQRPYAGDRVPFGERHTRHLRIGAAVPSTALVHVDLSGRDREQVKDDDGDERDARVRRDAPDQIPKLTHEQWCDGIASETDGIPSETSCPLSPDPKTAVLKLVVRAPLKWRV